MSKQYEQQREAIKRYLGKQDEFKIRAPRGVKAIVEQAARAEGESVNQYILNAVMRRMGITVWPIDENGADACKVGKNVLE